MPKSSTSSRHASHQDGKKVKKAKDRGHQYRDAAKARKLKQTRIKGLVEEVMAPVEPGKARPLRREPKYNWAKIGRMIHPKDEKTQPVNTPTVPAAVYIPDPVDLKIHRVIVPTSEATAKRKQVAAGDDDGDTTDVDDSEDAVVVPAGFVENLVLLKALAASSGPHEELEEHPLAPHAQPNEKPPVSAEIETHPSSPTVPQKNSSSPSPTPSTQPVLVEAVWNDSQTATSPPIYFAPSQPGAPTSVPQTASVPESFQEADGWDNNTNAQDFHQQDIQNVFQLGSTSDDVDMEFLDETTIESPVYSLPTTWTLPQPQPEYQASYSNAGQVAYNNNSYQAYTMDNVYQIWASMQFQPVQNESVQQFAQINQPLYNHSLTAATCFWISLSGNPETSHSPTDVPEIIKSTPTQGDGPRPQEPNDMSSPKIQLIWQSTPRNGRYRLADGDRGLHPFPNPRACKNMRLINMSGELAESHIIRPMPRYRRFEKQLSLGSGVDLTSCLRMEAGGEATQVSKIAQGKQQREDSQPGSMDINNPNIEVPPRQRRHCEPDASKVKTPVPTEKRSHKSHRRNRHDEALLKEPTSSGRNFSRFCPSISSLADRLFKFF